MIKAKLSNGTLILGLSALNVQKLKEGMPIVFDATELGYAGDICICYGATEEDIARDLMAATKGVQ